MKKVLCLLIAFILLFPPSVSLGTDEIDNPIVNAVADSLHHVVGTSYTNEYWLGTQINSYRIGSQITATETELYPVYENDEIVAFVDVFIVEDEVFLSFSTAFVTAFNEYIDSSENDSVAILYAKDGVYILNANGNREKIYDWVDNELSVLQDSTLTNHNLVLETVDKEFCFTPKVSVMRANTDVIISVTRVPNMSLTSDNEEDRNYKCGQGVCDNGICWAASMAMIINKYNYTSYDARDIHDKTGSHGYATYANYMQYFTLYYNISTADYATTLSGNSIKSRVDNGRLMFARIGQGLLYAQGHIVVFHGYAYDETGAVAGFYFMDPNSGSRYQTLNYQGDVQYVITAAGTSYVFDYAFSAWK